MTWLQLLAFVVLCVPADFDLPSFVAAARATRSFIAKVW